MQSILVYLLIIVPVLFSVICLVLRNQAVRKIMMILFVIVMFGVAYEIIRLAISGQGNFTLMMKDLPFDPTWLIRILDVAVLGYVIYIGFKLKHILISLLSVTQMIVFLAFEIFGKLGEPKIAFKIDYLSIVLILLVSIIGPMIAYFSTGYMKVHEHHQQVTKSKQPRFFAIILVFLGAMNALVMADSLLWIYLFWEVTTLCSFLLISHDGNELSIQNASRALWINLFGGLAFLFAIVIVQGQLGTLSMGELLEKASAGGFTGLIPFAVSLLCLAGFTKAAQFPFQKWLLGAMVAPTPVSALLHSSTMVKAGVYIIVRMSPLFGGTLLGTVIAVVGGFTFMAASAMAIGHTNSKSVLANSTIANLGLIVCCAGIGTHVAIGAAILLIIFHAVSKGMLFLCVGTIEQEIGSKNIENMQGLMKKMPFTTVITVVGMISMLLPPFGVLLTKWLAIEAAVNIPIVLVLIILGSAFTVVFWAKWIGILLTMSYKSKLFMEKLDFSMKSVLATLLLMVLAVSVGMTTIYNKIVVPYLTQSNFADKLTLAGNQGSILLTGGGRLTGGFATMPFFIILFVLMFAVPLVAFKTKAENIKPPYVGGELANHDIRGIELMGPMDKVYEAIVHNYYFKGIFGERNLTLILNTIAGAIIIIMFGVVI